MNELGKEARALIEAARPGDEPSPEDRLRIRNALLASLATGAAGAAVPAISHAATATASTGMLGAGGVALLKKALAVALLAGAVGGGTVLTIEAIEAAPAPASSRREPPTPTLPTASPAPIGATPRPAPSASIGSSRPESASDPTDHAPNRVDTAELRTKLRAAGAPGPRTQGTLAAELEILKSAQVALRAGRHAEARRLADAHLARFPEGVLRLEARATRLLALCGEGPRQNDEREVGEFVRAAGRSPLAEKVRTACAPRSQDASRENP